MIRLRSLGTLTLTDGGGTQLAGVLDHPKQLAVLLYLALAVPRGVQRRDTLLALLWPELPDARARVALNKATHFLRKLLGSEVLLRPNDEEVGVAFDRLTCDAIDFAAAVERGDHEAALALYAGELLPGLHVSDAPDFMQWLDDRRRAFRRQAATSAMALSEGAADTDSAGAMGFARRAREIDPLDERSLRAELSLLDRLGDRAGALREFEDYREFLRREFEAEPSPETCALVETIRARTVADAAPAPARTASDPAGPAAPRTRRWSVAAAASVVAVLVAVSSYAIAGSNRARGTPVISPTTVAVLPFIVRAAPEHIYLGEGVTTLLAEQLDGVGTLKAVSPRLVFVAAPGAGTVPLSDDTVSAIATRFGAGLIVTGSLIESGGQLSLSAELLDHQSGRVVAHASASGALSKVFDLVARVATQLATEANIGMSAPAIPLSNATQSVAALRAYMDGERAYRVGSFSGAVEAFQRAVELDTNFALAHWRLSMAARWAGNTTVIGSSLRQASRLSSRLSPTARLHVQALQLYDLNDAQRALAAYENILRRNPSDADAWAYSAEIRNHLSYVFGGPMAEATADWQRVIALEPGNASALIHLMQLSAVAGDRSAFERYTDQLLPEALDNERRAQVRLTRAFVFGDSAALRTAAAELPGVGTSLLGALLNRFAVATPDLGTIVNVMMPVLRGDLAASADWLQISEMWLATGRGRPADVARAAAAIRQRDPESAWQNEAAMLSLPHMPMDSARAARLYAGLAQLGPASDRVIAARSYSEAMVALRIDDVARAERVLARIDRLSTRTTDSTGVRRLGQMLKAELLAHAGQHRQALAELGPPIDIPLVQWPLVLPKERDRVLRAELAEAAGDFAVARRWYATIPHQSIEDVAHLPWARYKEGQMHERLGDRLNARRCYERALALMRGAEPDVQPFVALVRGRLVAVGGRAN